MGRPGGEGFDVAVAAFGEGGFDTGQGARRGYRCIDTCVIVPPNTVANGLFCICKQASWSKKKQKNAGWK